MSLILGKLPRNIGALICLFFPLLLSAQTSPKALKAKYWADSVLNTLTLDQKIGQMIMISAYSRRGESHVKNIQRLIRSYHLGGIIMMQGGPARQIQHVNTYQATAKIPLLISQDAEWGLGMRLDSTISFPRNMTLGAIQQDSLLYHVGVEMADQLKRVGVNFNFAPAVDINNNPANPVIHTRSFGENRFNVAKKGMLVSWGMQDNGVLACAKHFPGHGDTNVDSHYGLPSLPHSPQRLDSIELYPFDKLIQAEVGATMVSHLAIPSLDDTPNQPASLSPKIIKGVLREKMNYEGIIITDALNMQGASALGSSAQIAVRAFKAGNDILLFPADLPNTFKLFRSEIEKGDISLSDIDAAVSRILRAKFLLGLYRTPRISPYNVHQDLHTNRINILLKQLYESAVTVPLNQNQTLPIDKLENRKIAYLQVGGYSGNIFDESIQFYTSITPFYLRRSFTSGERKHMLNKLKEFDTVIIGLYGATRSARSNFGVSQQMVALCKDLNQSKATTVLTVFGTPYSLKNFGGEDAIVLAYEGVPQAEQAAAAAIFGGIKVSGKLPVTASEQFKEGTGFEIPKITRFGFAIPEEARMDSKTLSKIDSIAEHYIRREVIPGCAVLVARGDRIVFAKGFGQTREGRFGDSIDPFDHTYDLASITKVAATTLSAMRLVEEGKLDLDAPIVRYLPDLLGTNKEDLTARHLMQHNAGLPAWIPFFTQTYLDRQHHILNPDIYSDQPGPFHKVQLAENLFVAESFRDSMWQQIKDIQAGRTRRVRYSDLGMILLGKVIESISGQSLEEYTYETFYAPMGMDHTYFNPYQKGKAAYCPPTQIDTFWRKSLVQGFVHDQASALFGGQAGHAGLFANGYDLLKLLTMVKNGGTYGNRRYLQPSTIRSFTSQQLSYNRKGLGWDRPEVRLKRRSPVSSYASTRTFGHTGFTGTAAWVDPQFDLVYIFLSNRTYPYMQNRGFNREEVRNRVMDKIYEAIAMYEYQSRPMLNKYN